ncbi:MAG TPA: cyclic nucleotide-binding domain-containing protein [Hyalangium sp.]|nr:cyclic nucleotide-binding domain-containing protein [Hyalangium sp.]
MEVRKLRDKATEAFAKGRFSKAAEFYEDYCKAEPKDHQARLRMGDAWAKAGQKNRAISAYQLAATGFAREGFLPRAIAASKLILELDPQHKGVQQMLADLYARKSAGGNNVPLRPATPARRVELPTFTEHIATSMGPAVALLDLPEEEPAAAPKAIIPPPPEVELPQFSRDLPPELEIPVHEPLQIPESEPEPEPEVSHVVVIEEEEEEELAVVQGVVLPPAPSAAAPATSGAVARAPQPPPSAPAVPPPPTPTAPAPAAVEPPRAAGPAATAATGAPPGLAPRASQRPSVAGPAAPAEPPRQAPPASPKAAAPVKGSQAASSDETALELDLGLGTEKLSWAPVSEPLIPMASPVSPPPAPASPVASGASSSTPPASGASGSAPPGLRPRRSGEGDLSVTPAPGQSAVVVPPRPPSAPSPVFTELELGDDTLLHAVEEAALLGMKQRAAASPGAALEEEEIALTEEMVEAAPSVEALPNIPLFSDLPREAFIELFERCPLRRFPQGSRVFEQGTHGNAFYVICEGSVRVFRQEATQQKDLATLSSGAFFGEMALLSGAPRMASVESASEDTQLLEISAPVLAELSRQHPHVAQALKKFCRERMLSNVMSTSALFEPFNRKDRRSLVEKFRAREVKKNEIIVREGEKTDGLYVVLSGEVEARKGDQVLSRLKEGELFGEISLLSKTPATATVMATRRTSLLRLPREDFDALILSHPQILVLISELSEQRLRRTEALTGGQVIELTAEELLV